MLVALQFPFTDVRPFLQGDTHQLAVPTWGNVDPTRDFIRSVGPIRTRLKGALEDWPEEDAYCRVSTALRFDPAYHAVAEPELAPLGLRRFCVFRRFMADGRFPEGSVVARLELGFGFRSRTGARLSPSPQECVACTVSTLRLPVTLRGGGPPRNDTLLGLRELFDNLYLRSSSKLNRGQAHAHEPWWFRPGLPLALVEFAADNLAIGLPPEAKPVPALAARGIDLAYLRRELAGTPLGVWLVGLRSDMRDRDLMRRVRIHLFRLHAERQSLAQVLRLIRQKKIELVRDSRPTNNLQAYLRDATNLLNHKSREGLPQSDILTASQEAEEFAQPGERGKLLAELEKIRPNVFRNVATYLSGQGAGGAVLMKRNKVFISYAHADKKLFEEFKTMLAPAIQKGIVDIWDDTKIQPGAQWKVEIEQALAAAKVGVLLVSQHFLASEFITKNELPPLLTAAQEGGATIFWVCLSPCLYQHTEIEKYQAAHEISKPLDQLKKPHRQAAWTEICNKLLQVVGNG
jgi:hypothetical protein